MAVTPPNVKTTNNYFERTDTLVKYYRDVNEFSVIDADKEKELFTLLNEGKEKILKAKKNGDKISAAKYETEVSKLRDFIINSNLRFVISMARVYATNSNIMDLIDEGNIGLIEAVDTFDVSLGNRFQTHAVYLIRQKINQYRQNDDLMIKKNNESKTYHIMSNAINRFIQEFHRDPTDAELKDYINKMYPHVKLKKSSDVTKIKVASIDEPTDPEDGDANIGNISTYNQYSSSHNEYEDKMETERLSAVVNTLMRNLSDRDRTVIKMYFGIGQKHNAQCPVSEIAEKVNLTKERVRQLIDSITEKLRSEYNASLEEI